jgi:hypothetical protein
MREVAKQGCKNLLAAEITELFEKTTEKTSGLSVCSAAGILPAHPSSHSWNEAGFSNVRD